MLHTDSILADRRLRLPKLALLTLAAALLCAGCAGAMGAGAGPAPAGTAMSKGDGMRFVPGEVLVRFRADVGPERRDALLAGLEMHVARSLGGQNAYVVALPPGLSVTDAIGRLRALPEVEAAEPNRITPREPMPGRTAEPYRPR